LAWYVPVISTSAAVVPSTRRETRDPPANAPVLPVVKRALLDWIAVLAPVPVNPVVHLEALSAAPLVPVKSSENSVVGPPPVTTPMVNAGDPGAARVPDPVRVAVPGSTGVPAVVRAPEPVRLTVGVQLGFPGAPTVPPPDRFAAPGMAAVPLAVSVPEPVSVAEPEKAGIGPIQPPSAKATLAK
jgi:hypothetical protein